MLLTACKVYLLTSTVGAVLALLLWLLRPLTSRYFPPMWQHGVWLVSLAVMLLPIPISLPARETFSIPSLSGTMTHSPAEIPGGVSALSAGAFWEVSTQALWLTLAWVWVMGAVLLLIFKVIRYFCLRRRFLQRSRAFSHSLPVQYTRRYVRVRVSTETMTPLLMGACHPTLFLPDIPLNEMELEHILSHEMAHLRHGDLWHQWLVLLAKCVHWFNPMVYIVAHEWQRACEIACDHTAVKHLDAQGAAEYLRTVLRLASMKSGRVHLLATGMTGSGRLLKTRFLMVKRRKKFSTRRKVTASILAVILAMGTIGIGGVLIGFAVGEETPVVVTDAPAPPLLPEEKIEEEKEVGDTTWRWPCPASQTVSYTYGMRWGKWHGGVDISAEEGAIVVSAADGTVAALECDGYNHGHGRYVVIDHGINADGQSVITQYAHLSDVHVQVGERVAAGQTIGTVGVSGDVTGPCLHVVLQVDGEAQDPLSVFK